METDVLILKSQFKSYYVVWKQISIADIDPTASV